MRPSRPLDTIILDREQKNRLVADIRDYLKPSTRKWYGQRGIPYRRGYLFCGPPGTGKTSLSFALADIFSLDIFCVSLAEPSITEEHLVALFDELPDQCLVLLEDIDSAGLKKCDSRNLELTYHDDDDDSTGDTSEADQLAPVKVSYSHQHQTPSNRGRISLSGLLNVIDGVASQEGRVLIMTTNDVDALDGALLRPGRVDARVPFRLALKEDAKALFLQTFVNGDLPNESSSSLFKELVAVEAKRSAGIERLAETFAARVPESRFTPADIQGFLLKWRNATPEDAAADIENWVKEMGSIIK